jgi:site-specific DNA-cytosine methylase
MYTAQEVGAPHRRERVFILGLADPDSESEPDGAKHEEARRMPGILADPVFRGLDN